jgi:hypothetical protein
MNKMQIEDAVRKATKGISQYLEIMDLLPEVNVATDAAFQRKYNAFYRVRQRPAEWYQTYFSLMQGVKDRKPSFDYVLDYLHGCLKRCEPSFSSKLVATLNPEEPIWDTFVLANTNTRAPLYSDKNKIGKAKIAYKAIQDWYREFLKSDEGKLVIGCFDSMVSCCGKIADTKKVDFVLWQTRSDTKA